MSKDYAIADVCSMMGVSRAGYYKWKKHKPSKRDISREEVVKKVKETYGKHSTHGYRWMAAFLRRNENLIVSDNLIYKCFRHLGIESMTLHKIHYGHRNVRDRYPNLIFSTWETVDRPRQVIVSDMTALKFRIFYFEVTFYFDVFTKEMLSWKLAERRGARSQYIEGLQDVENLLKGSSEPVILHTDQGSVYSSKAYNELIKDTMIVRSMSRAGKPTDNPVNESLNGWIKEELMIDYRIDKCHSRAEVESVLEKYQDYYNRQRPCYALGYDTPENYRKRYYKGELPKTDTFSKRQLSKVPKFVQKRISAGNEKIKIENDTEKEVQYEWSKDCEKTTAGLPSGWDAQSQGALNRDTNKGETQVSSQCLI